MKKIGLITVVYVLLFQSFSFAGPTYQWSIPDNVRIVQSTAVDNVRVFLTIQSAINSITNASSTNPYQIKVMPGTYSTPFTLPSYVSLAGSGKESCIINIPVTINGNTTVDGIKFLSNAATSPLITVNGTVELKNIDITVGEDSNVLALLTDMESNVILSNASIKVVQSTGSDPQGTISHALRIGVNGTLEIKNSKIDTAFYGNGWAFPIHANDSANLTIDLTKVNVDNVYDASMLYDGTPSQTAIIKNSEINLSAEKGIIGVDTTNIKIIGSKITANSKSLIREIQAVHCWGSNIDNILIDNSIISATLNGNASPDAVSFLLDGCSGEVSNSNLSGPVAVVGYSQLKIGNSKIGGGIKYLWDSEYGTYKFFGCHDDNYQACEYPPIP